MTPSAAVNQVNNLLERLKSVRLDSGSEKRAQQPADESDDQYYFRNNIDPPRFAYYEQVRKQSHPNSWDYDARTTMDELDFHLRKQLSISPEERYRSRKEGWLFHPSNMGPGDTYPGCSNLQCVPGVGSRMYGVDLKMRKL